MLQPFVFVGYLCPLVQIFDSHAKNLNTFTLYEKPISNFFRVSVYNV